MKFTETALPGVYIVEPQVFGDNRGFFMESWSSRSFEAAGLHYEFVQDNHSLSTVKGTLRGIHFQRGEKAQAKLVRCVRGGVLDVAVDLRPGSPFYKKWVAVELTGESRTPFCRRRTASFRFCRTRSQALRSGSNEDVSHRGSRIYWEQFHLL